MELARDRNVDNSTASETNINRDEEPIGISFCKNLNDSETLSALGMDEKDRMLHR